MIGILLKILAVIGIGLLILLGFFALFCLFILFIPIRYQLHAEKKEEKLMIYAKVKWLMGFASIEYSYPEAGEIIVKILGIRLKQKKEKKIQNSAKNNKVSADEDSAKNENGSKSKIKSETDINTEKELNSEVENIEIDEKGINEEFGKETQKIVDKEVGIEIEKVKTNFYGKFVSTIQKIKYTIQNTYDKIRKIWDNIYYYLELLQDANTYQLWLHVKMRMLRIFRNVKPRKICADIEYGTGSPDTTGYLMALYGMFSPYLGKRVFIKPDFENKVLKGYVDIKGHITTFIALWNVLKLILDKKMRLFVHSIKSGREKNG